MDTDELVFLEQLEQTKVLSIQTAKEDEQRRTAKGGARSHQPSGYGGALRDVPGRSAAAATTAAAVATASAAIAAAATKPSDDISLLWLSPGATVQKSMSMPTFPVLFSDNDNELGSLMSQPGLAAVAGAQASSGGLVMRRLIKVDGDDSSCASSKDAPDGSSSGGSTAPAASGINPHRPRPRPRPIIQEQLDHGAVPPPPPPPPARTSSGRVGAAGSLGVSTAAGAVRGGQAPPPATTAVSRSSENVSFSGSAADVGPSAIDYQAFLLGLDKSVSKPAASAAAAAVERSAAEDSPPLIDFGPVEGSQHHSVPVPPKRQQQLLLLPASRTSAPVQPPPYAGRASAGCPVNVFPTAVGMPLPAALSQAVPGSAASLYRPGVALPLATGLPAPYPGPVVVKCVVKPTGDLLDLGTELARPRPESYDLKHFDPLVSPDAGKPAFDARLEEIASRKPQYVIVPHVGPAGVAVPVSAGDPLVTGVSGSANAESPVEDAALQDPFSLEELSLTLLVQTRIRRSDASPRLAIADKFYAGTLPKEKQQLPAAEAPDSMVAAVLNGDPPPSAASSKPAEEQHGKSAPLAGWQESDDESKAFCSMVSRVKFDYLSEDEYTNLGIVLSSMVAMPRPESVTVKVEVQTSFAKEPVTFPCDVNTAVEAVIANVLCTALDDQQDMQPDFYMLRVAGLMEYLMTDSCLSEYEYVQQSLKLDEVLHFVLDDVRTMEKPFKRTADDDHEPVYMINYSLHGDKSHKRSPRELDDLIETYLKQHEVVRTAVVKAQSEGHIKEIRMQGLLQSVKCVTTLLGNAETLEIRNTLLQVKKVTSEGVPLKSQVLLALDNLSKDIADLTLMYCKTFRVDYRLPASLTSIIPQKPTKEVKDLTTILDNVIVHIASAHRLPMTVLNRFEQFKIGCQLYHGERSLFAEVATPPLTATRNPPEALYWDCWLELSDVPLCTLPRETRLVLVMLGYDPKALLWLPLGWVAVNMFDHKGNLVQGGQMLSLWQGSPVPTGTTGSNIWQAQSILVQINLPEFDWIVRFPEVESLPENSSSVSTSLSELEKQHLLRLIDNDPSALSKEQLGLIWEKRFDLVDIPSALPLVLSAAPCWNYAGISSVLAVLRAWKPLPLLSALGLLMPRFPSMDVRLEAVRWLRECSSDDLCECMPQLIQVLKFESYHDSPLAQLLLERSLTSIRFAHRLYWTIKDAAAHQPHCRERFTMLYGGLMSVVGAGLRKELDMEDKLGRLIGTAAEKVKEARDKEAVLERELRNVSDELRRTGVQRLPISPGMAATGLDTKLCTYYNSFTTPLRLVFSNADEAAGGHYLMYKIGDDIRQDMLVMQIIRQMDRLWQKHDLDLRMMTFDCLPLAEKRGFVELITGCETLRKIQLSNGITGSFKDQPVSEWLKKHNPTEPGFEKAVENFTLTCAGCCVATYVLGICDRHNDNIMLKTTGHMFHIDFSKFLGDVQTFGKIKRDRAPFVFTSDMAYVINGGDKHTERFQQFIDLCCEAFNIIRRNADSILTLVAAMQQCSIPGVNADGLAYVQQALLPGKSEWQATTYFTQLIEESLRSVFTQLNFFFHNLAQLKFFNHNDGELLSFAPKTYSLATDGRIKTVEILSYQKRYIPEKHYVYVLQVFREHQRDPTLVFRRYSEFQEFHTKLMDMFPSARLPVLPGSIILGRTHVQRVAERRKFDIERFLRELLHQSAEIAEHDLVYTFFHPMQRDEKDTDRTELSKSKDPSDGSESGWSITGQVKLSLHYSGGTLSVMVMHAKRLANETGEPPHPYVKTYLLPDPIKSTKRKTKTAKSTFNPTYNEMLLYKMPASELRRRTLQVSVWSDGVMRENLFLGQVNIPIAQLDLSKETSRWYALAALPDRSSMDGVIVA